MRIRVATLGLRPVRPRGRQRGPVKIARLDAARKITCFDFQKNEMKRTGPKRDAYFHNFIPALKEPLVRSTGGVVWRGTAGAAYGCCNVAERWRCFACGSRAPRIKTRSRTIAKTGPKRDEEVRGRKRGFLRKGASVKRRSRTANGIIVGENNTENLHFSIATLR